MNKKSTISYSTILFTIFLILKLTNNIDWSWWWVTSPLWIPISLVTALIIITILIVVVLLMSGVDVVEGSKKITNKLNKIILNKTNS